MVKIIKCVLVLLSTMILIANGVEVGEGAITIGGSPVSNNNNNNNAGTMGGTGAGTTKSVGTAGTDAAGTGASGTGATKSVGGAGTGASGTGATKSVGGAGTSVGGTGTGVGGTGATGTGIGGTGVGTTTKGLGAGVSTTTLSGLSATPSATDTKKTETKTDTTPTKASKSKEKKKSFFSSTFFYVILGIFVFIIALLGYFYYVGSKDEREEQMRNLENGGNKTNNYGVTQTVEINKGVSLYDDKPSYGETASNPFADSNKVEETDPYSTDYNTDYNTNYNTNYDSPAVSYQNPPLMAAPAPSNPFDSPNLDAMEDGKNMKNMSNGFPDSLPQPSVVKLTEIEKPQQGNTVPTLRKNNEDDDILKPSMVRMTNIETPVPSNTIPTDKDISIGDDILKPSMVTLTEIQTPKESSLNNGTEKEKENEEEPKKAVVNMIDLKTPSSNEALNASNLLTPSIMITSTDGKTEAANTGANEEEEIPEEYSEMPEPRPFRAIHAYEPQINDELRLEVNNEIDVLYEYDDGWCWAINKTTDEQGACPMLCLISIKEEATGEREWEKEMDVMKVPGRRESMLSNSFDTNRLSLLKSK